MKLAKPELLDMARPNRGGAELRARVIGLMTGFGALHALHTLLNLAFTLVQLLVFARGLDPVRYAEVVFLTAVGVYLQPVSQAIGRANYVALRPGAVGAGQGTRGEVVWLLYGQAGLLLLLSFAVPLWFGIDDPSRYFGNALYLFGCLFTNYWSYDLQSTVWSADLGRPFALISIIRRVLFFVALALFWFTRDFLIYGLATTAVIVLFTVILVRLLAQRSAALQPRPGAVTRAGALEHLRQFWISFLSALSELLVLNSPYAVVTALFGVGPVLVAFDSVMKVGRLAMAGTRTFAEIFLPRISRLLLAGDTRGARRGLAFVTAVCVGATAIPAAAVLFFAPTVFGFLLGPNNVVPPEAATAAALIVLTTGLYQPAVFFLSYLNAKAAIRRISVIAFAGFLAYAALLYFWGAATVGSLWIYAGYFLSLSLIAAFFSGRIEPWEAQGAQ